MVFLQAAANPVPNVAAVHLPHERPLAAALLGLLLGQDRAIQASQSVTLQLAGNRALVATQRAGHLPLRAALRA